MPSWPTRCTWRRFTTSWKGEHRRQDRPRLAQHHPHRALVHHHRVFERAEQPLARAGLPAHRVRLDQPVEGELDVLGHQHIARVEANAGAQPELVGARIHLAPGFRDLVPDAHVRVARQQPVMHVADDVLGVAVAVVRGVERQHVGRGADAHLARAALREGGRHGGGRGGRLGGSVKPARDA
jgi:hypothetical protein